MATYSTDRRGALKILGAIGASCACPTPGNDLFGRTADEMLHPQSPGVPTAASFFTVPDLETISRVADLIIPPTDTPGAVSAGVPKYIDMIVSRNASQQALMVDGLRWLDLESKQLANCRFVELSEYQQLSLLQPLCEAADAGKLAGRLTQFFALTKSLTADGYYTSNVGLMTDLSYKGNSMMASYPECTHEH